MKSNMYIERNNVNGYCGLFCNSFGWYSYF